MRRRSRPVQWHGRVGSDAAAIRPSPTSPSRGSALRRLLALVGLAAAAALLSSCRVDTVVRVESDEFGSGRISISADLDRNAAEAAFAPPPVSAGDPPSTAAPVSRLQIDDLKRAGWDGPGLVRKADGSARFQLSHRFTTVEQANALLSQLGGAQGPLAGLRLGRSRSPWSTTISLSGPGDFTDGLAAFGDEQLGTLTGNGAFGLTDAEVLRQAGSDSLDNVFSLRLDARLLDAERTWSLPFGNRSPVALSASSTAWATIAGSIGAVSALAAYLLLRRAAQHGDAEVEDSRGGAETSPVLEESGKA